jgi:hypothetical protein
VKLGDYFSKKEKKSLLLPKGLVIGTVIRAFVKFTKPPKIKRFVVIGFHDNKVNLAALLINSEVNEIINYNKELKSHHLPLIANDCEYLDKDSFIDCTEIQYLELDALNNKIREKPEIIIGEMNKSDMDKVMRKVIDSPLIKGKHKNKCGCYNYKFDEQRQKAERH